MKTFLKNTRFHKLFLLLLPVVFLLPACLFLSVTGCKKDRLKTTVDGKVQDATTLAGIAGATAYLQKVNPDCFSCQGSKIASVTADADGKFQFDFTAEEGYRYSITAEAPKYFNNFYTGGLILDVGKKNHPLVGLQPEAYLKLHIKNTQPFDENDQVGINGEWSGSPEQFYGTSVDTFTFRKVTGNGNISIYWGVIKNSLTTNNSDSVYCPAFDTAFYNINY